MHSFNILGGDTYLPKLFVVNGHFYWFLNVAKRAAYGTNYPIEVFTIKDAYHIATQNERVRFNKGIVEKNFDQTGNTFKGRLFDDPHSPLAEMVNIPIVPLVK